MGKISNEQLAGEPVEYSLNGETYKVAPIKMGAILAKGAALLKGQAIEAVQESYKTGNPEAKRDVIARVACRVISSNQVFEWLNNTREGMVWFVHQSLKQNHPRLTLPVVDGWPDTSLGEITALIGAISYIGGDEEGDDRENPTDQTSG